MGGFEFLRTFRAKPEGAGIPVVVLTARDLSRDDRRRLHGATEVLNKGGTSLGDLSRELKKAVEGSARPANQP